MKKALYDAIVNSNGSLIHLQESRFVLSLEGFIWMWHTKNALQNGFGNRLICVDDVKTANFL